MFGFCSDIHQQTQYNYCNKSDKYTQVIKQTSSLDQCAQRDFVSPRRLTLVFRRLVFEGPEGAFRKTKPVSLNSQHEWPLFLLGLTGARSAHEHSTAYNSNYSVTATQCHQISTTKSNYKHNVQQASNTSSIQPNQYKTTNNIQLPTQPTTNPTTAFFFP